MTASLVRLLDSIKAKKQAGKMHPSKGISFASEYVSTLSEMTGGFSKHFKTIDAAKLQQLVKDTEGTLIHRDDGQVVTGGESGGQVFGDAKSEGLTEKSILDFGCILTSKRKDRDGDILHPDGADLDPKMPLLWQHMPFEPIGKMVKMTHQDGECVKVRCAVADTPLGRDAATLIEFGALRISHGFQPTKFEPVEAKEGEYGGWEVFKYHVMEVSVVSIPSNVDAVIDANEKAKLHTPFVKEWAVKLNESRQKFYKGGFDPANLTINVNLGDAMKGVADSITKALGPVKGTKPPKKKDDEPPATDDGSANGGSDDSTDDSATGEGDKVLVSDIADAVEQIGKTSGLPDEAVSRIQVVSGILAQLTSDLQDHAAAVAAAADDQDLVGLCGSFEDLTESIVGRLNSCGEELQRVAGLDEMPEAALTAIQGVIDSITAVNDALTSAAATADDATTGDGTGATDSTDDGSSASAELDGDDDKDADGFSVKAQEMATQLVGRLMAGQKLPRVLIRQLRGELKAQLDELKAAV